MRTSFRITFTDYVTNPDDEDCLRRAAVIPADRITFDGGHLLLWIAAAVRARFPVNMVEAIEVATVPGSSRREDPEQLRARFPNFGRPWSAEDEAKLITLHREGQRDFDELATEFGRQPTAIRSRLAKLGLEQL
ncbi:SANT/Myb-like DNA-binding domain-containing protein [Streptomyces sp. SYP-A7185]|uniref:SANT/Myb-like DNA-binding domain-containing protein n=1 Tax=Streptomyces sp. SYP-A7185 TaxID=3040076 RepID=UPI0038F7ADD6